MAVTPALRRTTLQSHLVDEGVEAGRSILLAHIAEQQARFRRGRRAVSPQRAGGFSGRHGHRDVYGLARLQGGHGRVLRVAGAVARARRYGGWAVGDGAAGGGVPGVPSACRSGACERAYEDGARCSPSQAAGGSWGVHVWVPWNDAGGPRASTPAAAGPRGARHPAAGAGVSGARAGAARAGAGREGSEGPGGGAGAGACRDARRRFCATLPVLTSGGRWAMRMVSCS